MTDRIKEIRQKIFKTQDGMASALNIKKQSISDYERDRTTPNKKILKQLAIEYNINLNYLIAGIGNMLLNDDDKTSNNDTIKQLQAQITELQANNDKLQAQIDILKSIIQSNQK